MNNTLPPTSVFISMVILFVGFSLFMENHQVDGREIFSYKVENIDALKDTKTEKEIDVIFASKPLFDVDMIENLPFQWQASNQWSIAPANMMQIMAYSVQTGQASVSMLEGNGGGVVLNVNRWRRQLSLPPIEETDIQKMAKPINMPFGLWYIFKIVNIETQQATYGAIVQNQAYTIFVKLTGDLAILQDNAKMFMALVMSFENKEEIE